MLKEDALREAAALVEKSGFAMLGTNGKSGYPNIKAMIKFENEGIKKIWFSTNTSSKRVQQILKDGKTCVYFADFERYKGLMLIGEAVVLQDRESKRRLWREGCEMYYPLGIDDPDYSVICFTARSGNFYHALSNLSFEIE
jgi:general stress protein 26